MKVLHTSDWHLGQNFMSKDRKSEHQQFLNWLIQVLKDESVDCLLISGDIFDTYTPPNYALSMYYNFLRQIPETNCKSVVIIGGNHDSISTLHAPKELLKLFDIHIVAGVSTPEDKEPILIKNGDSPIGIVCPVPFLRDRDIRTSLPGESYEDKSDAYTKAVLDYYQTISEKAAKLKSQHNESLPVIGTGHLFTLGGATSDSVRDIFVGNLGQINAAKLPKIFDYIALGHLHRAQSVKGYDSICYSGSPIPLSFSELKEDKIVNLITFEKPSNRPCITAKPVPEFRTLLCLKGDLKEIENTLDTIDWNNYSNQSAWLEVIYSSSEWIADIQLEIEQLTKDLPVEVLAIKTKVASPSKLRNNGEQATLDDITPMDVFEKRLELEEITTQTKENLSNLFNDVLNTVYNQSSPATHEN